MKDYHLMVDIETLDNKSHAAVLSIAAVLFDMETGSIKHNFYNASDVQSNLEAGLNADPNTALWWMKNHEALKFWLDSDKHTLTEMLTNFRVFIEFVTEGEDFFIWGNSNRFDMGILDNAYHAIGQPIPWKFKNERDVRTLVGFAPEVKGEVIKAAREAGKLLHNPLVDCEVQIEYCSKVYNKLKID